ncbi:MAG: flagellar motor protein MotB [Chitinophagaceae bacterium]
MKLTNWMLAASTSMLLFSCVSNKKFKAAQAQYGALETKYITLQGEAEKCKDDKSKLEADKLALNTKVDELNKQIKFLQENNTVALRQLQDLSVISASQAESIKKSMENIGAKDNYIKSLQQQMAYKDSLNMALVINLKGAIGNLDDKDINVKVDKGVVFIDISDRLLFNTGKYELTKQAKEVLGKVAKVLLNQPDIEFMVEGHTDNAAYKSPVGMLQDNWDLSVKRATSVVRVLQNEFGIPPAKMVAAGRAEYNPIASNDTPEGKAANRRTRIVILPQLDQFFKLLEPARQ